MSISAKRLQSEFKKAIKEKSDNYTVWMKENDIFNSNLTKKWQKRGKLPKLSSFDKFYLLNKYYIAHFVKPKNGLIKQLKLWRLIAKTVTLLVTPITRL